jgi:transposase-like protein
MVHLHHLQINYMPLPTGICPDCTSTASTRPRSSRAEKSERPLTPRSATLIAAARWLVRHEPTPVRHVSGRVREELLAFYDLPPEHWQHLRTTNPIESTFATVKLRTYKTKGPGSREAGLAMVFKLTEQAQKRWRRLNGSPLLAEVVGAIEFVDGVRKAA